MNNSNEIMTKSFHAFSKMDCEDTHVSRIRALRLHANTKALTHDDEMDYKYACV